MKHPLFPTSDLNSFSGGTIDQESKLAEDIMAKPEPATELRETHPLKTPKTPSKNEAAEPSAEEPLAEAGLKSLIKDLRHTHVLKQKQKAAKLGDRRKYIKLSWKARKIEKSAGGKPLPHTPWKAAQASESIATDTDKLIVEMMEMVESAGYQIPEGMDARAFVSDVEMVLASGEEMEEHVRAFLINAVAKVKEALAREML